MNTIVTISLIVVSCLALRAQQLDVVADVVQFRGNGAEAQWELITHSPILHSDT